MGRSNIYIRADGNEEIGLGHVSRSLALAEMLQPYFVIHFIIQAPDDNVTLTIQKYCNSIISLSKSIDYEKEADSLCDQIEENEAVIVLDGYNFTTEYQRILKNKGHKLVCIDDIPNFHIVADVIINHGGAIKSSDYSKEEYTRLFLGMKYALLKKPFRDAALRDLETLKYSNSLLVCMGGADPQSDIFSVLENIKKWHSIEQVFIVIGNSFKEEEKLEKYLSEYRLTYRLLKNVSAQEMVALMQKCRAAILPPSTMSYEYMSVGGLLILKQTANNQEKIKDFLVTNKLAIDYDHFQSSDLFKNDLVSEFKERQRALFDGKQKKRILRIFQELLLTCRKAEVSDCKLIFNWANDPSTRLQSFSSDPIPYHDHLQWFEKKIRSAQTLFLIINLHDEPIGQIRFDYSAEETTISYSLDKFFRGRGLGGLLLEKGIQCMRKTGMQKGILTGLVKKDNIPSIMAFRNLGFLESTVDDYENTFKFTLT